MHRIDKENKKYARRAFSGYSRSRGRLALPALLFWLCCAVSGCAGEGTKEEAETAAINAEELTVCFFACSDDADSILLKTGDTDILIDTGLEEDAESLLEGLSQFGVDDIELLILTHPDKDHIGGAGRVLDAYTVERVIQTSCEKGSDLQERTEEKLAEEKAELMTPREPCAFDYGALRLQVYPPKEESYESSNNYSIAALAEYEGVRFFFAGDAKKKRISELLTERLPKANVYKAAHHGRDNKACRELIERLRPDYAVVTAREPEEDTKEALLDAGAKIYSTYGRNVVFRVSNGVLDVE